MSDLPNGFTGFANRDRDPDFESAGAASRRLRDSSRAASAHTASAPTSEPDPAPVQEPIRTSAPIGAFEYARDLDLGHAQEAARSLEAAQAQDVSATSLRWAWLGIDLSAIRHNVAEIRRLIEPRCRVMAIVKADGYGHGATEVSKAALGAGADRLAVATVAEGVALRDAGITAPIALLSQPPITSVPLLIAHRITPAIYEPDFAVAYGEAADMHGAKAPFQLAVNTGLNDIGVLFSHVGEFLQQISFHRALEMEGVFTEFATADSPESLEFHIQENRFREALEAIHALGIDPGIVHAANAAATYRYPEAHFDMVRCDVALYGIHPCEQTQGRLDLRPAMSVHARIVDARNVPLREGVSYGYRYRSPGSVKICTVPLGFADGLPIRLSGRTDFIMDGRRFRQVGDICMDCCMFEIDMRDRANLRFDPQVGDEVLVVGRQGGVEVTMDELASKAGTVPEELLVGFAQRLERVYF